MQNSSNGYKVVGNKKGEGGKAMATTTRVVGKQRQW
jgi:hypothetical protein